MERFHSLVACYTLWGFGILRVAVDWKNWLNSKSVIREWRQLECIWCCNSSQTENTVDFFLFWSLLQLLQCRCFSSLFAKTCLVCWLSKNSGSTTFTLRSSFPWTHQNQQFLNRQHQFRWSCHPNRHSLAYHLEQPGFLSACLWWYSRCPLDRTIWRPL